MKFVPAVCLLVGLCCLTGLTPAGADGPPTGLPAEVNAVFQRRCVECHGPDKSKAKVNLATPDTIARGGRKGKIVEPGRPDDSLLWQLVDQDKMPPKQPLSAAEKQVIRRWIAGGAAGLPARPDAAKPQHWAFRPPVRPALPAVRHGELVRTPVDAFIEQALEKHGLMIGPEAERATLLRRVCLDLTGLPPTPGEIDAFVHDRSPDAYEHMVDRFLASPRYGERWGKYWLDAAGYADSNGYFSADSDRPLAWRYRDYVIRSLNADKPYDRFVTEQLAGDELAGYQPGQTVSPETADLLVATHFLRNAPDGTGESDGNPDEVRTDRYSVLEGTLQITTSCLLGLTIQCARCHEHKFEPIAHDEYYRLEAIFYPGYCPDRWKKPAERVVAVGTKEQVEAVQTQTKRVDGQVKALETSLETAAGPLREQLLEERLRAVKPDVREALRKALAVKKKQRTPEQEALLKTHATVVDVAEDDLVKRFPEFGPLRDATRNAIAARQKERPAPLPQLSVFVESDPNPPVHHVLLRGQHGSQGPEVAPGVPAALCSAGNRYEVKPRPAGRASSGRRSELARWVTSPENPLFARVLVNRVWMHHFGAGIVSTPDNLGQSGARPSNPELLDFLATEFVRGGFHIKALHRMILCSATYRQVSTYRETAARADPDNRLLWRFPYRRLDAEAVRDAMLAAAGELDLHAGGPYVPTVRRAEGNVEVDENRPDARRRSLYLQQRRTQVATLLELFDAPSLATNCTYRHTSTVPLQSLALLNSEFALARARGLAERLGREGSPDVGARVDLAFRLACGRPPTHDERCASVGFVARQRVEYGARPDAEAHAWADFAQMLLASNAFLYVD